MTRERTVGCLFDGIHGFGLGLRRAGAFRALWTVENADYPRAVLAARVPDAEHLSDVREVSHPPRVDVLTGGFPCQDLSYAGLGAGISGSRSGLWSEYARIIGEVEPELVLIENVPALLARGLDLVLENLVELGYGVEWDCLPAAAFGAPHLRDRVWIAAHRHGAPFMFGQPAALMPTAPERGEAQWRKWPRAGWVEGNPREVLELEPLARLADVRRGRSLWPTSQRSAGKVPHSHRGLYPTPASMDATSGHTGRTETKGRHSLALHHLANGGVLDDADDADDAVARLDAKRWPTPTSRDHHDGASTGRMARGQLPEARDRGLLPTPMATHNRKSARAMRASTDNGRRSGGGQSSPPGLEQVAELLGGTIPAELDGVDPADLPAATRAFLPTPNARDGGGGTSDARKRRADGRQVNLRDAVREAAGLADPADLAEHRARHGVGAGSLNPDWVEWLMGFPLGWTNLDAATDDLIVAPWENGEPEGIPRVTPRAAKSRERLTALGNALVPQTPEWLGARYLDATRDR